MPTPNRPPGADRDLGLHGLEAAAGRVLPGIQERRQPRAAVRLEHGEDEADDDQRPHQEREVSRRHAADDEQRAERQRDHDRRAHVGLEADQRGHPGRHHDQRPHADQRPGARRLGGDQQCRVEDEAELGELGRLDLERTGSDPPLGAVHLDAEPRHQHQEQAAKCHDQQNRREPLGRLHPVLGEVGHRGEADHRRDQVALEVLGAVAAAVQRRRARTGAVDHHRAEGHQAEHGGPEHRLLRGALPAVALVPAHQGAGDVPRASQARSRSAATRSRKCSPRAT